jgi:hypothetical protein
MAAVNCEKISYNKSNDKLNGTFISVYYSLILVHLLVPDVKPISLDEADSTSPAIIQSWGQGGGYIIVYNKSTIEL